jgi:DNA-binding MarR family transcriptional regulator
MMRFSRQNPAAKNPPRSAALSLDEAIAAWDAAGQPGPLIRRAHQRSHDIFTELVGRDGPTRQQIALLIALHQRPGSSQVDVSAATGIDPNTIAEMLRRLVARGLVARARSADDSRAWELHLTVAGKRLLRQTMPKAIQVQDMILATIPPELHDTFLYCLRRVAGIPDDEDHPT